MGSGTARRIAKWMGAAAFPARAGNRSMGSGDAAGVDVPTHFEPPTARRRAFGRQHYRERDGARTATLHRSGDARRSLSSNIVGLRNVPVPI
jgi:hypothetical protein